MLMQAHIQSAQEQLMQAFRKHKKYVEKALTQQLNRLALARK
jgi:hypothetical protein